MLLDVKLTGSGLIKSYIQDIPNLPGIYKMLGEDQKILYIGKAKNLKKRLTNYIQSDLDTKTLRLISLVKQLEYNITNSELEALLLEAQLIKKLQPKFNILLKDGRSFPYIKLTLEDDYPQLIKYRGKNLSDGKFFGPFIAIEQVNNTLRELQKIFKLRTCSDNYFKSRKRPCLQYQIGRCSAPCVNKITKEEYHELVWQVEKFFSGHTVQLQQLLSQQMEKLSAQLRFEQAAEIRDRIKALSYVQLKSNLLGNSVKNADVIAIAEQSSGYCIQLFVYRNRQFYGNLPYFPLHTENHNSTKSEILSQFIIQHYQTTQIPEEIIINHPINDLALVTNALRTISNNQGVTISQPTSSDKIKLIENAEINAKAALEHYLKQFAKNQLIFVQIQTLFNLVSLPSRIEIYDNSHIMGSFAVGSMVVATQAGLEKKEYRTFNIPIKHGDDYEMLQTVLTRRLSKLKTDPTKCPSLIIIDGGKGHLSVAHKIMSELELNIPLACMAKGVERNAGNEQFHMVNKEEFTIDKNLPVMKFLQILRDEAHNFAIKNHRLRRSKALTNSSLDDIISIGKERKKALLYYFGSYKAICEATIEELSKVPGISTNIAKTIFTALHNSAD
ncbi:excinuclease ABC subunit UvrC [Candidatus Tisiphia endosymbiont of Nemotelus uliginosus]|uniref:excinuclease ABC subunit UvrC n=1 Tax=Candidatus Tisiphia endosymbiont of Nemotelus uliginosus TaxID=3077926 RepID=UPI0035C88C3C